MILLCITTKGSTRIKKTGKKTESKVVLRFSEISSNLGSGDFSNTILFSQSAQRFGELSLFPLRVDNSLTQLKRFSMKILIIPSLSPMLTCYPNIWQGCGCAGEGEKRIRWWGRKGYFFNPYFWQVFLWFQNLLAGSFLLHKLPKKACCCLCFWILHGNLPQN